MADNTVEKKDFSGKTVKVLDASYDPGVPTEKDLWRSKIRTREQNKKYLESAERYWYSDDWFGSERR